MRLKRLAPLLILVTLLSACAIKNNPQVNAETQWRLNTASQLSQANKDYVQFFTDVGSAQKSGFLTASQVGELNSVGHNLKTSLEIANQEWAAYISGTGTKAAVIAAVLKAEEIMLQLTASRSNMGGKS